MQFRLIKQFTDGTRDLSGDFSVDLTDAHVGLRWASNVPGKAWEVVEIIATTEPLPTLIAVIVDD